MRAQHRLSWIAKDARATLRLYAWRCEIGARAAAVQTVALVSVAFAVSTNYGAYSDVNLSLAAGASVLFATAVFLIARAEPRKLIGTLLHAVAFMLVLGVSLVALGGVFALIACYIFLNKTIEIHPYGRQL